MSGANLRRVRNPGVPSDESPTAHPSLMVGRNIESGAERTGCSPRPSGYVRLKQTHVCPTKKSRAGCVVRHLKTDQVTRVRLRVAEHRRTRKAAMHDLRRAATANRLKSSNCAARLRVLRRMRVADAQRKNRRDEPTSKRDGLEAWRPEATRRDQRALKGTKPQERCPTLPVDGFSSLSASVGRTGGAGPIILV